MGQYYKIVNLDKKQFIHPHRFDDGLKLCEFGNSRSGTLFALAALLADGNGRGGGDISSDSSFIGSWAGDRIVIAGDYGDNGKFLPDSVPQDLEMNLYSIATEYFKDISKDIRQVLIDAGEMDRNTGSRF